MAISMISVMLFLFFYGLERRVLVEDQDINPVSQEVVRLLHLYEFSVALTSYLSHFLAYVIARVGLEKQRQDWFHQVFEKKSIEPNAEIIALALAWHMKQNRPLSSSWAMRMAGRHSRGISQRGGEPRARAVSRTLRKEIRESFWRRFLCSSGNARSSFRLQTSGKSFAVRSS